MGGCSVFNCSNSGRKGSRMIRIPQNVVKRKLWLQNMNRSDCDPGMNARICEEHFSSEMWEMPKYTTKRKLRRDAYPNIFPEPPPKIVNLEKTILGRSKKNHCTKYIVIETMNSTSDREIIEEEGDITCMIMQTEENFLNQAPSVVQSQSVNQVTILPMQRDLSPLSAEDSDLATRSSIISTINNDISEQFVFLEENISDENVIYQDDYVTETSETNVASSEENISDENVIYQNDSVTETSETNVASWEENISDENVIYQDDSVTEKSETNDELSEEFITEIAKDSSDEEAENPQNTDEADDEKNIFPPVNEEVMKKIIHKQNNLIVDMKKKMISLKSQLCKLEANKQNNVYKKVLDTIFSEEQIRALISKYVAGGSGKVHKWSEEAIQSGFILKNTCGTSGYKELLKMGFPFPSMRTLRHTVASLNSSSEISDDAVETVEENFNANFDATDQCSLEFDEMSMQSEEVYDT